MEIKLMSHEVRIEDREHLKLPALVKVSMMIRVGRKVKRFVIQAPIKLK